MKSQSRFTGPWPLCHALLIALIALAPAGTALRAQEPPEPAFTGIVYFYDQHWVCSMDPDGKNEKSYWPATISAGGARDLESPIVPSYGVHNGSRWFLAVDQDSGELVAIDENGYGVVLLEPQVIAADRILQPRWLPDDKAISWLEQDRENWVYTGIYTAPITFDTDEGYPTLESKGILTVDFQALEEHRGVRLAVYNWPYDWSPTASQIVLSLYDAIQGSSHLRILPVPVPCDWDDSSWEDSFLTQHAWDPKWSASGRKISFRSNAYSGNTAYWYIETINVDGSDRTVVAQASYNAGGNQVNTTLRFVLSQSWAPASQTTVNGLEYLLYVRTSGRVGRSSSHEICRVLADGSKNTTIKKDGWETLAWRERGHAVGPEPDPPPEPEPEPEPEPGDLAIDTFELTNTSNPVWARIRVDWAVSGNDLNKVELEVTFANNTRQSKTVTVSGSQASGSHEFTQRGGHGPASVTLTVTDIHDRFLSDIKTIHL